MVFYSENVYYENHNRLRNDAFQLLEFVGFQLSNELDMTYMLVTVACLWEHDIHVGDGRLFVGT